MSSIVTLLFALAAGSHSYDHLLPPIGTSRPRPRSNQRQRRKARRQAHANGDRKAFD
jgi:hypothetical protein